MATSRVFRLRRQRDEPRCPDGFSEASPRRADGACCELAADAPAASIKAAVSRLTASLAGLRGVSDILSERDHDLLRWLLHHNAVMLGASSIDFGSWQLHHALRRYALALRDPVALRILIDTGILTANELDCIAIEADDDGCAAFSRALHVAAARGDAAVVRVLIHAGVDTNLTDELGRTALHNAAVQGHRDVVGFLLGAGADPGVADEFGQTAADLPDR